MSPPASPISNYLPYRLFFDNGTAYCKWLYTSTLKFTRPFFDETEKECFSHPINSKQFRGASSLALLPEWQQSIHAVAPSAFIFHVSRCGSTLISQLLGLNESHIVLAEVPFFDEILQNQHLLTNGAFPQVFRAAMHFYGQKRTGHENRLFIKTDSWHIFFYRQLREMYPDIPFIMLYRRPDEILRSQQKLRGRQAVPGLIEPGLFGFTKQEISKLSLDAYMVKVLEKYYGAFVRVTATDHRCYLVNYNEGAFESVQKIAALTNTPLTAAEARAISQRSRFHSKYPEQVFFEQTVPGSPPSFMEEAFDLYNKLESIRKT